MKTVLKTILVILILSSCSNKGQELLGVWNADSKFYSATYKVYKDGGKLKAMALYYDDGTTHYKYIKGKNNKMYLFENLKPKGNVYVDAVSGATKKATPEQLTIKVLDQDTLAVTSYIMHKPLTEKWFRKNNK